MGVKKFGPGDDMRGWSRNIQDIMDEMRNRSFCDYRASAQWLPNVNIYETQAGYILCVELAGVMRESIRVECPDTQHVCVAGHRPSPRTPGLDNPYSVELMEIDEGPFYRAIDFKEQIDVNSVEVAYETGHLWITIGKAGAK